MNHQTERDILRWTQLTQAPAVDPANLPPLDLEMAGHRVDVLMGQLKPDSFNPRQTAEEKAAHRNKMQAAIVAARGYADVLNAKVANLGADQQIAAAQLTMRLLSRVEFVEDDLNSLGS